MQSQNDGMISVHFQGKSFNISVIQVYAPTTNAKRSWSLTVLWWPTRPSRTNMKKHVLFTTEDWNAKVRKVKRYLEEQESLALE